VADSEIPSEEELREALGRVGVADVLVNALSATASLGFHRLSDEARDLPQARLAIEALRALEPVLRDGGVDTAFVRDLEQARANLQLAYAKAVAEEPSAPEPAGEAEHPPAPERAEEPTEAAGEDVESE
jgi:hypothetical protein